MAGNHLSELKLGSEALRERRYHDAMAHFIEAIKLNPHEVAGSLNLGITLNRMGLLDDSITMLEQAIRQAPALAIAHGALADAYRDAGQVESAIRAYEKACNLASFNPELWRKLGNMYLEVEENDAALHAFRAGLSADPEHTGCVYGLAQTCALIGNLVESEQLFRRLGELRQPPGFDDSIRLGEIGWMVRFSSDFHSSLAKEKPAIPQMLGKFDAAGDGPVIFAAADQVYFERHAEALVRSIADNGHGPLTIHLHVCNPGPDLEKRADQMRRLAAPHVLNVTSEQIDVPALPAQNDGYRHYAKTYYSCIRFLQLPRLMAAYRRPILTVDIDLVAANNFSGWLAGLRPHDIGLNCKTRKDFANTFLATMVYAGSSAGAMRYFNMVARYIAHFIFTERRFTWLLDQIALHAVWCHIEASEDEPDLIFFEDEIMNWMDVESTSEEARQTYLFLSHYSSIPRA